MQETTNISYFRKLSPAMFVAAKVLTGVAMGMALCFPAEAKVSVNARLDSASTLMGKVVNLQLDVEEPAGVNGRFQIFSTPSPDGIYRVCGDSVEMHAPVSADTMDAGNGIRKIKFTVPVQAFDSGRYKLPEFVYIAGADSAHSNSLSLDIRPVANVTAETPIDDYKPAEEPEDKSILDNIPDWLYNYWWILLLVLVIGAGGVYMWRRYKKEGRILPRKPRPTSYEQAISSLRSLKERKLWEKGMEKEYFTDLTEILRVYLERRFGINALEMTSRQILDTLRENESTKDKRQYVRQILDIADFVKFAKIRPLPADNIAAYENALAFVEETKPTPEELEKEKAQLALLPEEAPLKRKKGKTGKSKKKRMKK